MTAARAWLELGDAASAREELTRVNSCLDTHPDVLLLSWDIDAQLGNWDRAYETARELIRVIPNDLRSWLNRSNALRYMKGGSVEMAYKALLPGEDTFYNNCEFHFHLARYACQAGRLEEARHWLRCAGPVEIMNEMALAEPDLQPLWGSLDELPLEF